MIGVLLRLFLPFLAILLILLHRRLEHALEVFLLVPALAVLRLAATYIIDGALHARDLFNLVNHGGHLLKMKKDSIKGKSFSLMLLISFKIVCTLIKNLCFLGFLSY